MVHREVGVAVCGIIVGTMIGAGFVAAGRDTVASLIEADEQFVAYRQGFIMEDEYRRRAIAEEDRRTRPQAGLQIPSDNMGVSRVVEGGVVLDPEECVSKVRVALEIENIVVPLIPGRAIDQLVRSSIQDAFNDYMKDCLPYYEEGLRKEEDSTGIEFEIESESQAPFRADACSRYSGSRRSRCIVEQQRKD